MWRLLISSSIPFVELLELGGGESSPSSCGRRAWLGWKSTDLDVRLDLSEAESSSSPDLSGPLSLGIQPLSLRLRFAILGNLTFKGPFKGTFFRFCVPWFWFVSWGPCSDFKSEFAGPTARYWFGGAVLPLWPRDEPLAILRPLPL